MCAFSAPGLSANVLQNNKKNPQAGTMAPTGRPSWISSTVAASSHRQPRTRTMEEKAFALGVGRAAVVDPTDAKEGAGLWRTPWLPDPTRWRSLLGDELHHHAAAATPPVQKTRGEMIYIYREREGGRFPGHRGHRILPATATARRRAR